MKIHGKKKKNNEKWCFLSILSEERVGKDPETKARQIPAFIHESRGSGHWKAASDLTRAMGPQETFQGFLAPKQKPRPILELPLFGMLPTTLEQRFPRLLLTVIRDRPNSDPNYRKLAFTHPRPHKSYIGAVYIYMSRSAASDILNLNFKTWFARFRGQSILNSRSLQRKNAEARS